MAQIFVGASGEGVVVERISRDLESRLEVILHLGLGYLSLDRSTPTLSPGELQRLRLATQFARSNLLESSMYSTNRLPVYILPILKRY